MLLTVAFRPKSGPGRAPVANARLAPVSVVLGESISYCVIVCVESLL